MNLKFGISMQLYIKKMDVKKAKSNFQLSNNR